MEALCRICVLISIVLMYSMVCAASGSMGVAQVAPVVNAPNGAEGRIIEVSMDEGESAWKVLNEAIQECGDEPGTIKLTKGRYVFDDEGILARGGAHIQLSGLRDVVIDGQGSELVFHYIRGGFALRDCQRVVLKNFSVDWDVRLASAGVVVKLPANLRGIKLTDAYTYDKSTTIIAVTEYDTKAMKWKLNPVEVYYPQSIKMVEPGLYSSPSFGGLKVGAEVCVRHYVYEAHGFDFGGPGNEDISFEDITLYGAPGHAWVGYGCERGFRLSRCRIERKPGTDRLLSATADGAHFGNTAGDIIIEDCDFSYQGDDSINIHGAWARVKAVVASESPSSHTIELTSRWSWAVSYAPGDELKLCKSANLAEYARLRVKESEVDSAAGVFTVTVEGNLPEAITVGDYVGNIGRSSSNFVIRNNYFHDHRARGMLLQARNGLVEGNRVSRVMASAIQMTTDCNYWQEGFGCENVTIRRNVLETCNYATWERHATGRHMACINLLVDTASGLGDWPVHKDIVISDNDIIDTPGLAILVASAKDVKVTNNRITDSNTQSWAGTGSGIKAKAAGAVMITRAEGVEVSGNTFVSTKKVYDTGVYVDTKTTRNVVTQ